MRKALGQPMGHKRFHQPGTQMGDPRTHGLDFLAPLLFQLCITEDGRHHGGTVIRRCRPQVASDIRQLATYIGELFSIRRTDDQCTHAVAIQAEVLRAGAGDQHFRQLGGKQAHRPGVLLQAIAKALVGEVDQRQQLAFTHDLQDLAPVILGQVKAGRVMAARVQQYHVALGHAGQGCQHRRHIQAVVAAHVRVMADLEPGLGKNGFVDRPGRVAQPHATARQAVGDKVGTQAQGAGAAWGLCGASAAVTQQGRVGA